MTNQEWIKTNKDMEEFMYILFKLDSPYVKKEVKDKMFDSLIKRLHNRNKQIKLKD
tara:strand:- start:477 stop:644 length:168 start_codon:yes stop_codon:yes gene_type:complete